MRGTNPIALFLPDDIKILQIAKISYSIQGTGPFAGEPAIIVELSGCNLQCTFCDSHFEDAASELTPEGVVAVVEREQRQNGKATLVVLTGGEPMRQNIRPLVLLLNEKKFRVQVETSGAVWRSYMSPLFLHRLGNGRVGTNGNILVCSPKTRRLAQGVAHCIQSLVYICQAGQMCVRDGLPVKNTQIKGPNEVRPVRPDELGGVGFHPTQIYLLPASTGRPADDAKNLNLATAICLRHGYRLAVRINKLAGLP